MIKIIHSRLYCFDFQIIAWTKMIPNPVTIRYMRPARGFKRDSNLNSADASVIVTFEG